MAKPIVQLRLSPILSLQYFCNCKNTFSPLLLKIFQISRDLFKILARQLVIGIDLQGALKMQLGLGELACFGQSAAQVGLRVSVVWMQADGGAIMLNRFQEFALGGKGVCQIVVRVKVVWLYLEGEGALRIRTAESPRLKHHELGAWPRSCSALRSRQDFFPCCAEPWLPAATCADRMPNRRRRVEEPEATGGPFHRWSDSRPLHDAEGRWD